MLGVHRRVVTQYPGLCCRISRTRGTPRFLSPDVKKVLEANYRKDRYPSRKKFEKMSVKLGESYDRLYTWYSKRRAKERKTLGTKEIESYPLAGSTRPRISAVVKTALEAKYNDNCFPTRDELEQMAQELGESYERLYTWFFKRREKERQMVRAAGMESHPLLENLRPRISTATMAALETKYAKNRYPSYEDIEKMSKKLGESHYRISGWYHKRRFKERKVMKIAGIKEQPGQFRDAPNRSDLTPHGPRLEVAFRQDLYPTTEKIKLLAKELVVPWVSIAKWFTYRRNKERAFRAKVGLETDEFDRIGLKLHAKARHLQEFLDRTQNLHPSRRQLRYLASKTAVPFASVSSWFSRRRYWARSESGRRIKHRLSPKQVALLEERFARHRHPTKSAAQDIARELGIRSAWVQSWFRIRREREMTRPDH